MEKRPQPANNTAHIFDDRLPLYPFDTEGALRNILQPPRDGDLDSCQIEEMLETYKIILERLISQFTNFIEELKKHHSNTKTSQAPCKLLYDKSGTPVLGVGLVCSETYENPSSFFIYDIYPKNGHPKQRETFIYSIDPDKIVTRFSMGDVHAFTKRNKNLKDSKAEGTFGGKETASLKNLQGKIGTVPIQIAELDSLNRALDIFST